MVGDPGGKKLSSLPFPAIVGQEDLKRVLLAAAVNDELDGALIVGEKGTAKSTAVRALAELLPEQRIVADCPYACSPDDPSLQCADCRKRNADELPVEQRNVPLVTLPLGATRDRIVGTLSVADALAGEADFDPGLLARANRGILYVDEINLLDDHLVDVLLDAAASGVNTVERDGISVTHPSNFTLIGTMNPEEGDLRPQLRDRFALQATVEGCREIDDRVEIIDRALDRSAGSNPAAKYDDAVEALRENLVEARKLLTRVDLPAEFKAEIAELCLEAGVDGHRGDVATARTALTLAALDGRTTVIESDVREAATYALAHRLRSTPFEDELNLDDLIEERFDEDSPKEDNKVDERDADGGDRADERSQADDSGSPDDADLEAGSDDPASDQDDPVSDQGESVNGQDESVNGQQPEEEMGSVSAETSRAEADDSASSGSDQQACADESDGSETAQPLVPGQRREGVGDSRAPEFETPNADGDRSDHAGSRASAPPSADNRGPRVRTEPASDSGPIDAPASVRAAAARGETSVEEEDLRRPVRAGETAATIVFAVDASASMRPAMRAAKGVVLELLRDSYQHRDEVAVVAFAGDGADVLLPPTDSVSLAARHLKDLPSGDRTPLPAGIETTRAVIERADSDATVVVLVTDGRANVANGSPTDATREAARRLAKTGAEVMVVDAGEGTGANLSTLVAAETEGERVPLSSLSAETVRSATDAAVADR